MTGDGFSRFWPHRCWGTGWKWPYFVENFILNKNIQLFLRKKDSWGQMNRRMRKIRVIFIKENFKYSYPLIFRTKFYDSFLFCRSWVVEQCKNNGIKKIIFGGKLLIVTDGRSYTICRVFRGLFNAENPVQFGSQIRKLWFFFWGRVSQNLELP